MLPDPPSSPADDAHAIHALASGLIDYAGLFPPATLSMPDAVAAYAKHLASDDAWMLGRFILPVSRLAEFDAAAGLILPREHDDEPWPISALVDGELDRDIDRIFAFNNAHARPGAGLAVIDAVEIKVPESTAREGPSPDFIDLALDTIPEGLYPFFELPLISAKPGAGSPDLRGCLAALAGSDAAAKIRTGGITPDAIPPARAIAEFLCAAAAGDVPFKATAGLHHALRAEHPLTYEPGCPRAVMHGFLNVFVAAAAAFAERIDAGVATGILEDSDPRTFEFSERSIAHRRRSLDVSQIERARTEFALSYGSCSFQEPTDELRRLGLI